MNYLLDTHAFLWTASDTDLAGCQSEYDNDQQRSGISAFYKIRIETDLVKRLPKEDAVFTLQKVAGLR